MERPRTRRYWQRYWPFGLLAIAVLGALADAAPERGPPPPEEAVRVLPTPQQLAWQELELIAFAHFGVNTFTDREWGDGKESPKIFNPTAFDADQWVRVLKDAGFKLLILTAKHHDGFCLWPSRYTKHSVKNSPWRGGRGDVVREVAEACRRGGLKFGFYLSPWDRHEPSFGTPAYDKYFTNQLRELLTQYGEVTEVWFDGACGVKEDPRCKGVTYNWPLIHGVVRELQPKAVVAISGPDVRWVGNETGVARETEWSLQPGDPKFHGEKKWVFWPAECDVSIRPGWFYHAAEDDKVKSLDQLVDIYYKSVGRNSVLLVNVPPDRRGLIHENDAGRLREWRAVIDATFREDLARGKKTRSSSADRRAPQHGPDKAVDGETSTYWLAAEGQRRGWLEVDLGGEVTFDRSMVMEYLPFGQRIAGYAIEAWQGGRWQPVAKGTTVGYKKLDRFPAVTARRVRLVIRESLGRPAVRTFGLFKAP
jgi:alpha-L-fucosidase